MNILQLFNEEMSGLAGRVRGSLVRVHAGQGHGAGTIWHPEGLIITNAHVVASGDLSITLPDGSTQAAQLLAYDPERDLAALCVEARDLPTIELGKSSALTPGQWVMAVGHPWGVQGAATSGIVIGTGRQMLEIPTGQREWVMCSLHLRPGHSGGPLVNTAGHLVGINTIMTGPEVGGAVPVDVVKHFLKHHLN